MTTTTTTTTIIIIIIIIIIDIIIIMITWGGWYCVCSTYSDFTEVSLYWLQFGALYYFYLILWVIKFLRLFSSS